MTEREGYKDYVAGLLAGVATVIIGHPFDTVKVCPLRYIHFPFSVRINRLHSHRTRRFSSLFVQLFALNSVLGLGEVR